MFEGNWGWLALSSVIPLADIRRYPDLPWDKTGLSLNPPLTVDDIQSLPDIEWNWDMIPCEIRIIDVYTHPDLTWNRSGLSENKDIRVGDLIAWHEIVPSIYRRWYYPSDVIIM